jgi:predicted nucleotidyltransferase
LNFGLEDRHWNFLNETLIRPLKEQGASVWIFGSRAQACHRAFSDIDVLYSVSHELPPHFVGELLERMENSNFPFKVDLVLEQDLAEGYRAGVLASRVRV